MPELTVVHLVSASYDSAPVEQFAEAYRKYSAGQEHRLLVLLNGFDARDASQHLAPLSDLAFDVLRVPASTIDLNAYTYAAHDLSSGHICFLNSHSEPLVEGWLGRLEAALSRPGVGMVGATGSWETTRSLRPFSRWPRFPNAHLRTNAFIIERDLMTTLNWPLVADKRSAWQLESGVKSVTRQVLARGLEVLVAGRDTTYAPPAWSRSRTFRSGGQENLLVADNRTRDWAAADPAVRSALSRLAWGADAEAYLD